MMERKVRMVAPDMIKIAATIFVIFIHHKKNYSSLTLAQQEWFFYGLSAFLILLGGILFLRGLHLGLDKKKCLDALILPILAAFGIMYLRRFAVGMFLIMSGYLMSGAFYKMERPFRQWYCFRNLISRTIRFYLPLIPIFILALFYKMFLLDKNYSLPEIVVRFFLGGFRPGGYYVVILVQLVLLFPVIHAVVHKYKLKGVLLCVCFTLMYDVLATMFGMNDTLYKFLIFRLTAHIAFGISMRYVDLQKDKRSYLVLFIVGLVYVIGCVFTDTYVPTIFFRWRDVSVMTAFFLTPVIMAFIKRFEHIQYTESRLSGYTLAFANATYHIFLVQMLYYTTVGFPLNEFINHAEITLGLNVMLTVPAGILYFKLMNPMEQKMISNINIARVRASILK